MNRILVSSIFLLVVTGSLSSCGIFRKSSRRKKATHTAAVKTTDTNKIVTQIPAINDTVRQVAVTDTQKQEIAQLASYWQRGLSYHTFSGKAKMFYQGKGDKQDFTANIRIKKDSIIWITITAFGGVVQVARVLITPDSFMLVNYLQKEVYTMPLSDAAKVLPVPVDFTIMQNLIVGEALRKNSKLTSASAMGDSINLSADDETYIQHMVYAKTDSSLYNYHMNTRDPSGPNANITLSNYDMADGRKFATFRSIVITNAADQYYIDMNFTNYNFDQDLEYPFSIPKSYSRK